MNLLSQPESYKKLWTEWDQLLRAGVKTEFRLLLGQRVLTTQRPKDTDRQVRSSGSGLTSEGSGADSLSIRDLPPGSRCLARSSF